LSATAPGDSAELLLRQLAPESAAQVRLCAIPHQFSVGIIRTLAPQLDEAEACERFAEFSKLSIMLPSVDMLGNETLAMHDAARRPLFDKWLDRVNAPEFSETNRRLVALFESVIKSVMPGAPGDLLETPIAAGCFICSSRTGSRLLSSETRNAWLPMSECEALCKLVLEIRARAHPGKFRVVWIINAESSRPIRANGRRRRSFSSACSTIARFRVCCT
jgi:hypothetical protein